eukprot:GHUV01024339.1.p1 GENE.GHUV01024339.1~~GHUV01024339.1.p1  ORF type:complete len:174 (+),score=37.00 GHUV01024339.1:141-662(+)
MMRRAPSTTKRNCSVTFSKAEVPCCRAPRLSKRGRQGLAVRSELSTDNASPHSPNAKASSNRTSSKAASCPFLSSLPTPPVAHVPWYQRPGQLFNPQAFQELVLGKATTSVVQVPKQLWFSGLYVPAEAAVVKEVLAAELSGSIKQDIFTALPLGEQLICCVTLNRQRAKFRL